MEEDLDNVVIGGWEKSLNGGVEGIEELYEGYEWLGRKLMFCKIN